MAEIPPGKPRKPIEEEMRKKKADHAKTTREEVRTEEAMEHVLDYDPATSILNLNKETSDGGIDNHHQNSFSKSLDKTVTDDDPKSKTFTPDLDDFNSIDLFGNFEELLGIDSMAGEDAQRDAIVKALFPGFDLDDYQVFLEKNKMEEEMLEKKKKMEEAKQRIQEWSVLVSLPQDQNQYRQHVLYPIKFEIIDRDNNHEEPLVRYFGQNRLKRQIAGFVGLLDFEKTLHEQYFANAPNANQP